MKSRVKVLAVIATIAALGFLFAACDNPSGGGGDGSGRLVFERYGEGYRVVGYGYAPSTSGGRASGALVIPATHNSLPVVAIGNTAFFRRTT